MTPEEYENLFDVSDDYDELDFDNIVPFSQPHKIVADSSELLENNIDSDDSMYYIMLHEGRG